MRLIKQSHEMLKCDSIEVIERAARQCYQSEDSITEGSASKLIGKLISSGHTAMLEHASASVKLITNRGVTHELVRHRLAAYAQESTRYVKYCKGDGDETQDMEFILPVWMPESYAKHYAKMKMTMEIVNGAIKQVSQMNDMNKANAAFILMLLTVEERYKLLLDMGWQPQQAREVLPNALKTAIVVTANFREWRHIFNLRVLGTTGKPHPQIKALFLPVLRDLTNRCPEVFMDLLLRVKED